MKNTSVNLGAGGFVSYYEDGGAAVILDPPVERDGVLSEEAQALISQALISQVKEDDGQEVEAPPPYRFDRAAQRELRFSGRADTDSRGTYYPDGGLTFFETLAADYGYPTEELDGGITGIDLWGPTRHQLPRADLPSAQELEDVRAHMLASALLARQYGPMGAEIVGNVNDFFVTNITGGNKDHSIMDQRNNAVGRRLFSQVGAGASTATLTKMVDSRIFEQLKVILGRSAEEQGPPADQPEWPSNFRSPVGDGPDLYFPRYPNGFFIKQ